MNVKAHGKTFERFYLEDVGPEISKNFNTVGSRIRGLNGEQRDLRAEILRVIEPILERERREQILRRYETAVRGGARHFGTPSLSLSAACEAILEAAPEKRTWLRAAAKVLGKAPLSSHGEDEVRVSRALTTGDGLGQALAVAEPLAEDIYSLVANYGAWRTLGVVEMGVGKKKFATLKGAAAAVWLKPSLQGSAIPAPSLLAGAGVSAEVSTLAALVKVSGELLQDGELVFEAALLQALVEGLAYRLDWAAFRADGTDDTESGGMTGIFAHPAVPVVNSYPGHTTVGSLTRMDLLAVIGGVAPAALQRPCRFWIAPDLLPDFAGIKDEAGVLLSPPSGPADEWRLAGWPVTWTAAAPNADLAGAPIAAFGRGDAYLVGVRQDFELKGSAATGADWAQNMTLLRAIMRARCEMRDATGLAILKLALL
jgi:HK97 family phage major capsid protein